MKASNKFWRVAALLLLLVGMTGMGAAELFNPPDAGTQEWLYTEHTSLVFGVDVDSEGNVYSGSDDEEVHKINPDGTQEWTYSEHTSTIEDVAVDSEGTVYSGGQDNELNKIDSSGEKLWRKTYNQPIRSLAVDSEDYVYVAGDFNQVQKLDGSRNVVWEYFADDDNNGIDVDSEGNVYVGGDYEEVIKIDSGGNEVWSYTGHSSRVRDVAVDSEGYSYSTSGDGLHKVDSSGEQVWTFTEHEGIIYPVDVDSEGNTYVADNGGFGDDGLVRKIDSSGEQVWTYSGVASRGQDIKVDSSGYVHIAFRGDEEVHKLGFNQPPEFDSVSSDPEPPQINRNVSYSAELFDPDNASELSEVELQLEFDGEQVYTDTRSVSGDSDSTSWSDVFVPEEEGQLDATFTVTDTEGDSTVEELNYFLEDTPPEINIVQPENQTYWSYDIPYEIEVDSNNDAVPDQDFELEIYSDGELVEELSGSGTETFSGEFRQDLGDDLEFEAVANDTGGETSETTTYSVDFFEFTDFSSSNNVYETESEQFASTQEVGEMVQNVEYTLVWDNQELSTINEDYISQGLQSEEINADIPLVEEDKTIDWFIEAHITYEDFEGDTTSQTVEGSDNSQNVDQAFVLDDEFLSDGSTQLEASHLEYNADLDQRFEDARGSFSAEAEFEQTEDNQILEEENLDNQTRRFSEVFESELVNSSSESYGFDLDVEYEFQEESRSITSDEFSVDLDQIVLDTSGDEEVLRFEVSDEEDESSLDSDLEGNFKVYNPDSPELTREYSLDYSSDSSHSVYLAPGYGEVEVDVFGDNYIEFDASGDDSDLYDRRRHYLLGERLSSDTTVIDLFLLEKDSASRAEILVEDSELNPIAGQVVRVERSFGGGSEQRTVVMAQSGSTGTDSVFIDEDEQYVFTVFNEDGDRVDRFGPQSIPRDLEVELQIDEDPIRRFDQFIRGVDFEVTVLEDEVIVDYDTETEELNSIELKVLEDSMFEDIEVDTDSSTATSGQLRVDGFNASDGQFQYRLNGYFDGEEFITEDRSLLLDSGRFGEGVSEFQEGGLFISLMLFMVLTFSGLYRAEAAVAMGVLSLIVSSFVGFLAIGQTALIAVISVGAILVWRMT